jgi:TRAP-type uncharacterized transport system substrate-binding protein
MSADVPQPEAGSPPARSHVARRNQRQMLLFAALTLLLSMVTVWGGRIWLKNSETLVFAVGDGNGLEARFAARLAAVLKNSSSRLHLRIVPQGDNTRALAEFDHRQADLAVLRTDAKVPPHARALALLEHDIVLLISPAGKKIKSLADLRKKKVAVLANGDSNATFVRNLLEIADVPDAASRVQMAPLNSTLDKLLASGGYGAVIAIAHASTIARDKVYQQYAGRGSFTLNSIDESKALTRRNPAVSEETLPTGMLSSSPVVPDDDLDTIGLQWLLVAQARMSSSTAGDLARIIYENKAELALDSGFASKIEPADTDKDAFIVAHPGAAEYINDETKSFMDRYSDVLYLGVAALSVIGSIFAAIYAKVTRIAPERASELSTAILDIGRRVESAETPEVLQQLQRELEDILRGAVIGLSDGSLSSDGLDAFKLGYELVRDEIAARRDQLQRPTGRDDKDNVVMVKTAHSS